MELTIIGPHIYSKDEIEWIEVTTNIGTFVIQSGYIPSLLVLSPEKEVIYKPIHQKIHSLAIKRGILSVDRETATLLIHTQ